MAEIQADGIATLRLDQPERRNALSIAMRDAMSDTLDERATDDRVRVVVLTAAGTTFCAGFDLKDFSKPELAKTIRDSSTRYHLAVWQFPKPGIAAVNGAAFGGGFDPCLLCDMRIATPNAVFAHPEIKFGAPPLFTPLQWIVGAGVARELCLTGRRVDATEADSIGLVNAIVDAERLEDEAMTNDTGYGRGAATRPRSHQAQSGLQCGSTFPEAFEVEHDRVFDQFLLGELGPLSRVRTHPF